MPAALRGAAAQFAEQVELFGREQAADAKLGLRAQAHALRLAGRHFAREFVNRSLVHGGRIDGLFERAARTADALADGAVLPFGLPADARDLGPLLRRQAERAD